jgi:hypothetical protein
MKLVPIDCVRDIEDTLNNVMLYAEELRNVVVVAVRKNGELYLTHSLTTHHDLSFIQAGLQSYVAQKFEFRG